MFFKGDSFNREYSPILYPAIHWRPWWRRTVLQQRAGIFALIAIMIITLLWTVFR